MNCLIVDDDPLICDLVEHFCSKTEEVTSVLTTQSGFEAVNLIQSNAFDLIFWTLICLILQEKIS
ncbi:MAG: hypothetical protein CL842_04425 [Crocinitomicaceae bacterium]|nr:hypothetical protein [Crocinitomicaceae bacterium]